ncbi:MAG: hypothetical protein OXI87_19790 [Albidovulum sp.]|nr:hypothetical protein [Albidovulum sp.]
MSKIFDVVDCLSKLTIIAVAVIAFIKYSDEVEQRSFDRTYEYFKDYTAGYLSGLRSEFDTTIKEVQNILNGKCEDCANLNQEQLAELAEKTIFDGVIDNWDNYTALVNHFSTVRKCIMIDGCDEELLKLYFQDLASSHAIILWPFIKKSIHGYEFAILCFVRKRRKPEQLWAEMRQSLKNVEDLTLTLNEKCWTEK